jgi:hypothetical protein
VLVDHDVAIDAAAWANDLFGIGGMQAEHGRERQASGVDAVTTQREAGAAAVDDYWREHTKRMPPNAMVCIALLCISHVGQLTDEAQCAVVIKCEMIDPIN